MENQFKGESCCANCIYFEKFNEQKREDNILGSCKANPPQVAKEKNKSNLGEWPLVLGSWWCGVFSNEEGKN